VGSLETQLPRWRSRAGGALALQRVRGQRGSDAARRGASQQPEAPLDEPRVVERHRDRAPITCRCRGNTSPSSGHGTRRERPRQVGSLAELEPANRRRERRRVAPHPPSSGTRRRERAERDRSHSSRSRVAPRGGVGGGAAVGRDRVREHVHSATCCSGEALPADHARADWRSDTTVAIRNHAIHRIADWNAPDAGNRSWIAAGREDRSATYSAVASLPAWTCAVAPSWVARALGCAKSAANSP